MGPDCYDCKHCSSHYYECCLAGRGDDEFCRVTKKVYDDIMGLKNFPEYKCEEESINSRFEILDIRERK